MTAAPAPSAPAVELRGISKHFGAVAALEQVDMIVAPGTVHALLGENGAGKTTLMRITAGLTRADLGRVRLFGVDRPRFSVRDAIEAGVGMVHQHLSLVANLTTEENLVLGGRGRFDRATATRQLTTISSESGLHVPSGVAVRELTIVEQQRLEILKALSRRARLLILDEPTAVLAPSESEELMSWLRAFADTGGTVVLVTHKLPEALSVADTLTVLRRGRVVHAGTNTGMSEHDLSAVMFPEQPINLATTSVLPGPASVIADDVVIADARGVRRIRNASFTLHQHEIVGIAGVEGSGHHELLLALAGLLPLSGGKIQTPLRRAFIPADRGRDAIVADFSLAENVALRGLGVRRGLMRWPALNRETASLIERFEIVAPSPRARAAALSGGNQQRLVVARELATQAELVIADNPTRGLDARATAFVHEQLRHAAARGATVVVHSSDVDELVSVSSRILVTFNGSLRQVGLDTAAIGRAMTGTVEDSDVR